MYKIGFIGAGKISSAIVEAICTSSLKNYSIKLSPRSRNRSMDLANRYTPVKRMESNQQVLDDADIVFIALKPDVYRDIITDLEFRHDHIVVSLIPYTRKDILSELVKPAKSVSRAIPLPTVVNHNCPIPVFSPVQHVMEIFSAIGQPIVLEDEDQLHVLWALTGLITPYYDLLSELSIWSVDNGVRKEMADKYIADMFRSLSNAASIRTDIDFQELSGHAATPGGMNERAGKEIGDSGAHNAYIKAAGEILIKFNNI
jgi:pyrroline-5-carboxylate reductase